MNTNIKNQRSLIESKSFYQVYGWMLKLGLERSEVTIFAIIYGYSKSGISYDGSLSYLAEWSQLTKSFVIKVIAKLIEKKLIIKTEEYIKNTKKCSYLANMEYLIECFGDDVVNSVHRCNQYTTGVVSTTGGVLSSPNNIVNNIEDKLINRETDKLLTEKNISSLYEKIDEIKKYCYDNGLDYAFYKSLDYKISQYYYLKKFDIEECKVINEFYRKFKSKYNCPKETFDIVLEYTIDKAFENKKKIKSLKAYIINAFKKNMKIYNLNHEID